MISIAFSSIMGHGIRDFIALLALFAYVPFAKSEVFSRGSANQIKSLPHYDGPMPFKMYSGYLRASEKHFLHYW